MKFKIQLLDKTSVPPCYIYKYEFYLPRPRNNAKSKFTIIIVLKVHELLVTIKSMPQFTVL